MNRLFAALLLALPLAAQGFHETEMTFSSGAFTLHGTVTLPEGNGPWPGVVIIAGSGPTDRNGNSAVGLATDMFRQLAQGLAQVGIASFRYDKRGLPTAEGPFDMATATIQDYANDAREAVRAMDARPDIGRVHLLGHSEGGMLALLAMRDGAPALTVILASTPGRDLTTIIREQLSRQVPAPMLAQFDTAWAAHLRGDTGISYPPALAPLFIPAQQRFVRSLAEVRTTGLVAGIEQPVLIIQGTTDVQVTEEDARALAAANPLARLELLPGVNHVLKASDGTTALAQTPTYTNPSLPLAPGVVGLVAGWVKAH